MSSFYPAPSASWTSSSSGGAQNGSGAHQNSAPSQGLNPIDETQEYGQETQSDGLESEWKKMNDQGDGDGTAPAGGISYYRFFMKPQGIHDRAPPVKVHTRKLGLIPEDGELSPRAPSEISLQTVMTKNTVQSYNPSMRSVASNASMLSSCAVMLHRAAASGPASQPPPQVKRTPEELAAFKKLQGCSTIDAVFDLILEDSMIADTINTIARLFKRSKSDEKLYKNDRFNALLDRAQMELDFMSGRQLSSLAWSLAVTKSNRLWVQLTELIPTLTDYEPINLTNIAWAYANRMPEVERDAQRQLFYHLASEVIRLLPYFQAGSLANFIWAFSKVGYKEELLFMKVSEQCMKWTLAEFRPYDLCSFVWGFATAGYRDDKFLMALADELPSKVGKFNPQDLSNTIWSFSKLRFAHVEALHIMADECMQKVKILKNQDFTNILYGFALLAVRDDKILKVFQILGDELQLARNMRSLQLRHWCIMSWAYSQMNFWHPVINEFFALAIMPDAAAHLDPKTLSMVVGSFQHWYHTNGCQSALWALFDNLISNHIDLGGSGYSSMLKACETTGDVHRQVTVLLQLGADSQVAGLEAAAMNCGVIALMRANCDPTSLLDHIRKNNRLNRVGRKLWAQVHGPDVPVPPGVDHYDVLEDRKRADIQITPCGMTKSNEHSSYIREYEILQYVSKHSDDDPISVLKSVDNYSKERSLWLKITGDEKAIIVEQAMHLRKGRRPQCVLEIGCYVGYSGINMGKELQKWGGRLISIEVDPIHAILSRNIIEIAGLTSTVEVYIGHSCDVIPDRISKMGPNTVDHVFMDQKGTRYHLDLQELEKTCLSPDATIVADNVLKPGAPEFLWHLHTQNYLSLAVSVREYLLQSEDWVTIAFRGQGKSPSDGDGSTRPMPEELHRLAFKSDCMRQRSMWDTERAPETGEWAIFARHFCAVCEKSGCMTKPFIGEVRKNRFYAGTGWGDIKPVPLLKWNH